MNREYVPPPVYGPGKDNYGRGWGYKGPNKCPKCGKPASPNEVEICGGVCSHCSIIEKLRKKVINMVKEQIPEDTGELR